MIYEFKKQNNNWQQKEAVKKCQEFWINSGYNCSDVSENPDFFKTGTDLIKQIGDEKTFIDVKCDFLAHKTGNLPFELMEILPLDKENKFKFGWGYKNTIEEVDYFIWETKEIIPISLKKLRELAYSSERKGFASLHHIPFKYFTAGVLLPLIEIKKLGL